MAERWRALPGFPGYVVSESGRIRSLTRVSASGDLLMGREMAPQHDRNGYLKVCVAVGGTRRDVYLHRAVALAWVPNDDPARKTEVDHLNADHDDVRACNLEWVEPQENKRRAHETIGDRMRRRLTPEQVEAARSMPGRPHEVARAIGCGAATVSDIRRGRTHRAGKEEA